MRSVARAAEAEGTMGQLETATERLNTLKGTHPDVFWHWRNFCIDEDRKTFNPKELHPDVLNRFLAMHAEGSFAEVEVASPALCMELEGLKAKDMTVWWRFKRFCSEEAFGLTQPERLPAELVQRFLTQYSEGVMPAVELATEETVEKLQALRKLGGQQGWNSFCAEHSFGVRDPRKLPMHVAERFLSEYKPQPGQQEEKQQRKFTSQFRQLRQKDPRVFWQWCKFCSDYPGGAIDAMAFPEDKVGEFLVRHASGSVATVETVSRELRKRLDEVRNADPAAMWLFGEYSAKEAFGIFSVRFMPAQVVEDFLARYKEGSLPSVDLAPEELVKELNKLRGSGDGWRDFCTKHSFGIRDPKRFPVEVAQRFLKEFKPQPYKEPL